ncbi:hypothetical protein [Streptomyces sp. NPDC051776]|uniref:hypothetical protein n=1 Tax=Streptomyces sp. NPDC051776 TaxID=3155414 RepID=UPI003427360D
MRLHKIATATMLVLAVSGGTAAGTGTALADTGPAHGKAKARAEGGSTTGEDAFQQNIAQSSRQNNNCNNPNMQDETLSLTGSRATGRCVTSDGSLTAFSRIHNGSADAQGGSAAADVVQQNTAQRGRQNNNCNNPNGAEITLDSSRVEGRCADQDFSFSKHTLIKGGGVRAEGGSSTAAEVFQQNVAQEGRQNNNCNNPNDAEIGLTGGGRIKADCGNKDFSFSKHTLVKGGGVRAEGGSSTAAEVFQQNVAQEGRQNNNCNNPNLDSDNFLVEEGSRLDVRCGNKDNSFSKHTLVKGGGVRAEGGSSTTGTVIQQNVAQEGRQNNNCNNPNDTFDDTEVRGGSRVGMRCGNKDHSFSKHTHIKGGGARAHGGTGQGIDADSTNTAQEGRQNNNCNNANLTDLDVFGGGRVGVGCGNKDNSFSKHTHIKGGGARAEGGSSTGDVFQQNIAQEGRQNNNCNNLNNDESDLDVEEGGRLAVHCGNKDNSFSHKSLVKGGGARAQGGSGTGAEVNQQNIAQEGRQNNNCANLNATEAPVTGGRSKVACQTVDHSANLRTADIGGGAQAAGGTATAELFQQNTAQEGRQSNSCSNTNNLTLTATGSRTQTHCTAVDRSTNIGTEYR